MTSPTSEEPVSHLQVVGKLKSIPVIEHAYNTSAGVYNRVKGSSNIVGWALQSAEGVIGTAVGVVTPLANRFQEPISGVDSKLCKGIDIIEEKVPIVKDQPEEIYNKAKSYVHSNVNELQNASLRIADRSWYKANAILTTQCGTIALAGFDTTSQMADKFIDYYLPPVEGENDQHPHSSAECEDKVLHTIHTIGTLSHKMGTRVYRSLSQHFSEPRHI